MGSEVNAALPNPTQWAANRIALLAARRGRAITATSARFASPWQRRAVADAITPDGRARQAVRGDRQSSC